MFKIDQKKFSPNILRHKTCCKKSSSKNFERQKAQLIGGRGGGGVGLEGSVRGKSGPEGAERQPHDSAAARARWNTAHHPQHTPLHRPRKHRTPGSASSCRRARSR